MPLKGTLGAWSHLDFPGCYEVSSLLYYLLLPRSASNGVSAQELKTLKLYAKTNLFSLECVVLGVLLQQQKADKYSL